MVGVIKVVAQIQGEERLMLEPGVILAATL